MTQTYELKTDNGCYAAFTFEGYYCETPVLESDSEDVIQEKIALAKEIITYTPPE